MKVVLASIFLDLLYTLIASVGFYAAGRIVLPEMHLPVPPFGAVFWATFWVVTTTSVIMYIRGMIESD